ncbi:MAG: hypothetical protein R3352_01230 [Salinisphaeraceae bacterium]|nr:hypothetical protein [Salinisphaeraceae bacterium]
MLIKRSRPKAFDLDAPMQHSDHSKPRTRREFISQGFMAGSASVFGSSIFSLFASPGSASAALSSDLEALKSSCGIAVEGAGKIPFICFDLAGGANIAGSNVLVGGQGGQEDFLSTAGYSKLGLPGDMVPGAVNPDGSGNAFINDELGIRFHSDSPFLAGILEKTDPSTRALVNGAIIPARSENDTGNNPHNPMYGIYRAGADGSLLSLIGSRSSDSGANSMAPMDLMDPQVRPTKIDRPSDVTGLVDVGDLIGLLSQEDAVAVMESIQRISDAKMDRVNTQITTDEVIKDLVRCGYVKSADIADRFGDPTTLNPELDTDIVGPGGIFTSEEFNSDSEFRKTASVMKLVLNGFAGAGTITMGGFDYHTGERGTGERRDLRAGRCMGACLEYARRRNMPLMLYVYSDGSVASNGRIDDSMDGRGKGEWTGDNQSTAAAFYLVYDPRATQRPTAIRQQIGYMRSDASVETASSPAANNVNLLVQTVLLNYMALHGEEANFESLFPTHGLGNSISRDRLMGFSRLSSVSDSGIIIPG